MITDPTYLGLLAAVCADPDDDAPRLVLADRLDELGEAERAEYIRVSIESFHDPRCGHGEHVDERKVNAETCAICRRILRRHNLCYGGYPKRGWVWAGEPLNGIDNAQYDWLRGFVRLVEMTAADWLAHGDALSWHPESGRPCPATAQPIEEVRLTTWPDHRWQMDNLPPDWPTRGTPGEDRPFALDALQHRWPSVRRWHLPPATLEVDGGFLVPFPLSNRLREMFQREQEILFGNPDVPTPRGVINDAR